MSEIKKDYNIFGGSRFIESMRSGGYRDTSYAVGELVDNAIDAGSKHVEIMCQDKINHSTGRKTLDKIAILDDGNGMNAEELRSSLLFGEGTHGSNSKDIGKYGMGLPNSSLSQCKRVDVYSWTNSSDPICCHIDVDEVKKGKKEIQIPRKEKIPKSWIEASKYFSKQSGTLVVWSKLDRCSWTTSKSVLEHSKFLIGRIYRRFLAQKKITIHMIKFMINDDDEIVDKESDNMLPNDPMYLMTPSSTPGMWGNKAMFELDGEKMEHMIEHNGEKHKIISTFSIEKDELRSQEMGDQGSTKHGKHARKNTGISIMRADREIMLDTFGLPSDPRNRWWGVEIDIPPSLDSVVGLTNNKQQVDRLSALLTTLTQFKVDNSDEKDLEDDIELDETHKPLFDMIKYVYSRISSIERRIRATRAGSRSKIDAENKTLINEKINAGIQQDQNEEKFSESDSDRKTKKKEQRIEEITETYVQEGTSEEEAKKIATSLVNKDIRIHFESAELDGSTFFSPQNIAGVIRVKINSNHRAYKNLLLLLNDKDDDNEYNDMSCDDRLALAKDGMWLLLASWVRYEDLTLNHKKREIIQDIRLDWGKELNVFLENNES